MSSPKVPRTGPIEDALRNISMNRSMHLKLEYANKAKQIRQAHVRLKWKRAAMDLLKRLP